MDIDITRVIIRVDDEKRGSQRAELVGLDKDGNEYRLSPRVYVDNEYHDVETDIIYNKPPEKVTPRTCSD
jgi:hypothetical protein